MDQDAILKKFGDDYRADGQTFVMGIDQRFTRHFAERFQGLKVLETCTGAGFTTISLARSAKHVFTVDVNKSFQKQAIYNIEKAGLSSKVTFIAGSILDQSILDDIMPVDAAFIDPDWAVSGPDHIYRFLNSNTQPPADTLLNKIFEITDDIAIVLPPFIEVKEFSHLREHERERLFLDENHELFCLYFGSLSKSIGETEFRVPTKLP